MKEHAPKDASIREQLRAMLVAEIAPQFAGPLEHQRAFLDTMGAQAELPGGLTVKPDRLAGVPLEWISAEDHEPRVVVHLHGGGYTLGSCDSHRALAGRIAIACRARVVLPEYRLAPENRFPAAIDDAVAVYRALLDSGIAAEQIAVSGDSAGGGLTLCAMLRARERGLPMPRALVLISPWIDLTMSGESIESRAELDPWLRLSLLEEMRGHYLGDAGSIPAPASPLEADLAGLPPMLLQVGDHEILLSDSQRLHERATAAGIAAELEVADNLWHVWHLFAPALPEANAAIDRIGAYLDGRFAGEPRPA